MPSNFTQHYQFSQRERNDKVLMEDFNVGNARLDPYLAQKTNPHLASVVPQMLLNCSRVLVSLSHQAFKFLGIQVTGHERDSALDADGGAAQRGGHALGHLVLKAGELRRGIGLVDGADFLVSAGLHGNGAFIFSRTGGNIGREGTAVYIGSVAASGKGLVAGNGIAGGAGDGRMDSRVDLSASADLHRKAGHDIVCGHGGDAGHVSVRGNLQTALLQVQSAASQGSELQLADLASGLKGFVSVESTFFGGEHRYLDLSSIHVSEELRGSGIGSALFNTAKVWASTSRAKNYTFPPIPL